MPMITPVYERAQLWLPARNRIRTTVLAALIGAASVAGASYLLIGASGHAVSRTEQTERRMHDAVSGPCPARLGDVMAVPLDGWGHAFAYSCAPFTIHSAGEDGVFGTADDLRSHR